MRLSQAFPTPIGSDSEPQDAVLAQIMVHRDQHALEAWLRQHSSVRLVHGKSLLGWAAAHHWPEAILALHAAGADPHEPDAMGASALFTAFGAWLRAAQNGGHEHLRQADGCARTVEALLAIGASPRTAWKATTIAPLPLAQLPPVLFALSQPARHQVVGIKPRPSRAVPAVYMELWSKASGRAQVGRLWNDLPASHQIAWARLPSMQKAAVQDLDKVTALLAAGADAAQAWLPMSSTTPPVHPQSHTWLGVAIAEGSREVVQRLLEAGAYLRAPTSYAWMLAAEATIKHPSLLPLLVQQGWRCQEPWQAECLLQASWEPPHRLSAWPSPPPIRWPENQPSSGGFSERFAMMQALDMPRTIPLRLRLDPHEPSSPRGLLEHVLRGGPCVTLPLTHDTVINWFVEGGATPSEHPDLLHQAEVSWIPSMVKAGWQPDALDAEGFTPLHRANERSYRASATVMALLDAGASLDACDRAGNKVWQDWDIPRWCHYTQSAILCSHPRALDALMAILPQVSALGNFPPVSDHASQQALVRVLGASIQSSPTWFDRLSPVLSLLTNDSLAITWHHAASSGQTDILVLLHQHVRPQDVKAAHALKAAAEKGHAACTSFLLSAFPDADASGVIIAASQTGQVACVELLLPRANAHDILTALTLTSPTNPVRSVLLEHADASQVLAWVRQSPMSTGKAIDLVETLAARLPAEHQDALLELLGDQAVPSLRQAICARDGALLHEVTAGASEHPARPRRRI